MLPSQGGILTLLFPLLNIHITHSFIPVLAKNSLSEWPHLATLNKITVTLILYPSVYAFSPGSSFCWHSASSDMLYI